MLTDLLQIICNYLQLRDQIIICKLNNDTRNYIKIYQIDPDRYLYKLKLTENILKQNKFTHLIMLDITNNNRIKNVNYLKYLQELRCCRTQLLNTGINGLKNIIKLNIENCKYVTNIAHFSNLIELNCGGCCGVTDSNISNLINLRVLKASNNRKIINIDGLINLTELDCSWHCNSMTNENLKNLTNLKKLNFSNNNKITDINTLINLEYIICNNVIQLNGLNKLIKLKQIDISDNYNLKRSNFNDSIIVIDNKFDN